MGVLIVFNGEALEYLKLCTHRLQKVSSELKKKMWIGQDAKTWFSTAQVDWVVDNLSTKPLTRTELLEKIHLIKHRGTIDTAECRRLIIEILAWGGSRHRQDTMSSIRHYETICQQLLTNDISATQAYQLFYEAQNSGSMRGMGPAYYTKLICFLGDQSGLILDQWTARSMNKLLASKVVLLNNGKYVSSQNSLDVYRRYLSFISELASKLEIRNHLEVEEIIFSCSHKKNRLGKEHQEAHLICSAWRRYVALGETY